ncbi:MAG: amidohydrolase family protein [Pseudomonadota bacterium]|nr:amidohydrolase family protein [Pseudomonadota bacterium]
MRKPTSVVPIEHGEMVVVSVTTAITGGQMVTGLSEEPIANGTVLIEGNCIRAAGPADKVALPRDAVIIDAAGHTVLPGLIDCHVHSTYRARDVRQHLLNTPSYNILRSTQILKETLACGITSAREMSGADAGFREAINDELIHGPRLQLSILMISQTGGHGDYWVPAGMHVPKRAWLPSPVADGPDEMRKLVRHVLRAGADFVKVCTSGGITSVTDSPDEPQYTVEEIRVAVSEAANKGKPVAVHAEGMTGIKRALDAGVYSIEHGWFIDEECVDTMLRQDTWWVPTIALVPMSVTHRKKNPEWSAQQLADEEHKDNELLARFKEQIPLWQEAVRRGVRIAMGSDQSHRLLTGNNLVELEYMVDWLGMSPMRALLCATSEAAQCMKRPDLGALEAGRLADIVVVEGDPLTDIRLLQRRENMKLVMKAGQRYTDQLRI